MNDAPRRLRLASASPSANDITPSPVSQRPRWTYLDWRKRAESVASSYRLAHRLPREDRRCAVTIVRVVESRRRFIRDDANLRAGCKPILDGLVRGGLLADDSDRWMTATYEQRVGEIAETFVEVTPDATSERRGRPTSGRAANGRKRKVDRVGCAEGAAHEVESTVCA